MRTVLIYTGDSEAGYPFLRGVPARDLTADDLKRLAWVRGVSVQSVRAALVASGMYRDARRTRPAEPMT